MFVLMDTSSIERSARPYIPILLEALTESPVERQGKFISFEEIVAELEEDTIAESTGLGLMNGSRFSCGSYSHSANLMLQV